MALNDLQAVISPAFEDVASLDKPFTAADIPKWESWVRTNLGDFLYLAPYESDRFNLADYIINLVDEVSQGVAINPDDHEERNAFLNQFAEFVDPAVIDPSRAPTPETIQNLVENTDLLGKRREIIALVLVYCYHLRRSKNRADDSNSAPLPPPTKNPSPPPPIMSGMSLQQSEGFFKAEEEEREKKRAEFVEKLRLYKDHRLKWKKQEKTQAQYKIVDLWGKLDKWSQRDLKIFYDNAMKWD